MYAPHKYTLWVLTGFAKTKKDKKEAPLISTHNISLLFSCVQKHLSLETVGRMANRFFFLFLHKNICSRHSLEVLLWPSQHCLGHVKPTSTGQA